jgi:hypothetical protein
MKHTILALETVNALITEPSIAYGIEKCPDIAVLALKSPTLDWGAGLDALVDGCVVLGFKKIILDLKETEISSSFLIACVVSAWHRLIENGGTLVICGLSEGAYKRFQELIEPRLFNMYDNLDVCIDWLDSVFGLELDRNFPRDVKCTECGTVGQVAKRGEHLCTECGVTYLVTERGELPF